MSEQKVFPRVSDEDLLRLKKAVTRKLPPYSIVSKAFCWLLDKTDGLTKQVAVFVPPEHQTVGVQIALGFHGLRSKSHADSVDSLMKQFGNGFITWSCSYRYVCGHYDKAAGGNTFRLSVEEHHNTDEVEIPFDLAAIEATPLSE